MDIQVLRKKNAEAFYRLRLEGLEANPDAFGESAEEFAMKSPEQMALLLEEQLEENGSFVLGAFEGQTLIGVMGFRRFPARKLQHLGVLWGAYVTASARGKGVGECLIQSLIKKAKELPGLKRIRLGVNSKNIPAFKLYAKAGFEVYGTEKEALMLNDEYIDEYLMTLLL